MSLIGENYFCTYYRWTVGEDLPPLVAGSILFTADEGTIKKTCGHMAIFFGQSIHKNCFNPDLVDGNSSLMHSAILLEGKVEDGTYWLQMAEATISDGIVRNWENMDLILDERQADSLYLVIPKSESLRNRIVELENIRLPKQRKRSPIAGSALCSASFLSIGKWLRMKSLRWQES